jgi:hypothetical protein
VDEITLPEFLVDTVASMRMRRRAGEWDVDSAGPAGVHTGDAALAAFLAAFPWAHVAALERRGEGVEAELDLVLAVQDEAGTLAATRLPGAGQFVFDPSGPTHTMTVWPNLFTDEIYLYRAVGRDFERFLVRFDEAATRNRDLLHSALLDWETLTGGAVEGFDSELVDGIETHGFAGHSRPE